MIIIRFDDFYEPRNHFIVWSTEAVISAKLCHSPINGIDFCFPFMQNVHQHGGFIGTDIFLAHPYTFCDDFFLITGMPSAFAI